MKSITFTFLFSILSISVFAQVFVKLDATGNNDGSSWEDAFTSLQDAIDFAETSDFIWVANGIYTPGVAGADPNETFFFLDKSVALFGGFAGSETSLTERDIVANETILSGDLNGDDIPNDFNVNRDDNSLHVLFLNGGVAGGALLDGFSIESGMAEYGDPPNGAPSTLPWFGGGVLALSDLSLLSCTFRQNGGSGGAALVTANSPNSFIEDCVFENNDSEEGAVILVNHFDAQVIECTFRENHALNFGGGLTVANSNALVEDCEFMDNRVTFDVGGGIYFSMSNFPFGQPPSVTVRDCNFNGNEAPEGGAIAFNNFILESGFNLNGCTFENNSASFRGGGIMLENRDLDGTPTSFQAQISDCIFSENEAYGNDGVGGGAALLTDFHRFEFSIESCEFIGNSAETQGGGVFLSYSDDAVFMEGTIMDSNFESNTTKGQGGGVRAFNRNISTQPDFTFSNCTFSENEAEGNGGGLSASSYSSDDIPGPNLFVDNCLFENNLGRLGGGGLNFAGPDILIQDSHFEGNYSTETNFGASGGMTLAPFNSARIQRSIFTKNSSPDHAGAIAYGTFNVSSCLMEDVLFTENEGLGCILSGDSMHLRNVTMVDNSAGLQLVTNQPVYLQNCLFANDGENLKPNLNSVNNLVSFGGNLSDDATMVDFLIGTGEYADFNEAAPLLDADFVPTMGSPCVDAGNPEGIEEDAVDVFGSIRNQGLSVDIGAVESPFLVSSSEVPAFKGTVEVFPNPFSDEINVAANEQPIALRLFDAEGSLVKILPQNESKIPIDKSLKSGVYFLEFEFESGTATQVLVKK